MSQLGTYLFLIMGGLFLANAVVVAILAVLHRRRGIAVTAEVVDMRETTTSDGGPAFAPVFLVRGGEHSGKVWASWAASDPAVHEIGEVLPATYDPRTGVIQSKAVRKGTVLFAVGMLVAAIACFSVAAAY